MIGTTIGASLIESVASRLPGSRCSAGAAMALPASSAMRISANAATARRTPLKMPIAGGRDRDFVALRIDEPNPAAMLDGPDRGHGERETSRELVNPFGRGGRRRV